ncbi:hypothetical protein COOONC_10488 [Cooperia oncophora]
MDQRSRDIRTCLLYEFKLRRCATLAQKNLVKAFGENSMSLDTVRRWYRRFRHGYESVDYRKKGPVKVDDDLLEEMANTKMSASEMAKFFGVQIATINMHLKNISQGRKTTFLNRQSKAAGKLTRMQTLN